MLRAEQKYQNEQLTVLWVGHQDTVKKLTSYAGKNRIPDYLFDGNDDMSRKYRMTYGGGVVFIDVPNECSLWTRGGNAYMRIRGRAWAVNLSPTFSPYHVVGFCPRSLRHLALSIGYEVVEVKTHRWRNDLPQTRTLAGRVEALGAELALSIGSWIDSGAAGNPGLTEYTRAVLLSALGRRRDSREAQRRVFIFPDRTLSHALARDMMTR